MWTQLPILLIIFNNSQDKVTSTFNKVGTFVSGILIISLKYSGILTRNVSGFSGMLEQSLGFSCLLEMGLSGVLKFSRKISASGNLTASSGPK